MMAKKFKAPVIFDSFRKMWKINKSMNYYVKFD